MPGPTREHPVASGPPSIATGRHQRRLPKCGSRTTGDLSVRDGEPGSAGQGQIARTAARLLLRDRGRPKGADEVLQPAGLFGRPVSTGLARFCAEHSQRTAMTARCLDVAPGTARAGTDRSRVTNCPPWWTASASRYAAVTWRWPSRAADSTADGSVIAMSHGQNSWSLASMEVRSLSLIHI